jgi:hypothetical protein
VGTCSSSTQAAGHFCQQPAHWQTENSTSEPQCSQQQQRQQGNAVLGSRAPWRAAATGSSQWLSPNTGLLHLPIMPPALLSSAVSVIRCLHKQHLQKVTMQARNHCSAYQCIWLSVSWCLRLPEISPVSVTLLLYGPGKEALPVDPAATAGTTKQRMHVRSHRSTAEHAAMIWCLDSIDEHLSIDFMQCIALHCTAVATADALQALASLSFAACC